MIDLMHMQPVADWRAYIDGLADPWQIQLEETCWEAFHYQVADMRMSGEGSGGGYDGGITSIFQKAGKGGICLRGAYNSMTRPSGWAHVRSQIRGLPEPLRGRVMDLCDGLGQRRPRSKYNPMIAWIRTEGTISADGPIVSWETHHPFLDCLYTRFTIVVCNWFDRSVDGWLDTYRQGIVKFISVDGGKGTLDLRDHGIEPAPGLVFWVRWRDDHGSGGGSRFQWPYGEPDAGAAPVRQTTADDPEKGELVLKGAVEDGQVEFLRPETWAGKGKVQIAGGHKALDRGRFAGLSVSIEDGNVVVEWEKRAPLNRQLTVEWQPVAGTHWVPADGGPVDPVVVTII